MTAIGELVVKIVPDAENFQRDTGREMRKAALAAEAAYRSSYRNASKRRAGDRLPEAVAAGKAEGTAQGRAHAKAAEDAKDRANRPDIAEAAARGALEGAAQGQAHRQAFDKTSANARGFRLQQEQLLRDAAVAGAAGRAAGTRYINGADAALVRGSGRVTKRTASIWQGIAGGMAFNNPGPGRGLASMFGLIGGKAVYAGAAISAVGAAMKTVAIGAVGVGLSAAAFTALSAASLKVAGTYQQQAAAMNVLMGSTEKGTAMMKDLVNFSKSTPFELEGTIDAAKRIMAMGFAAEEVIPTLTRIGNAAAALGTGTEGLSRLSLVMGQIRSKGKLMTQDVNQLAEQGIPLWDILAEKLGKTRGEVMDLTEQGLVPAETALDALNEYMDMKFSGTLQAQSETLLGTFENLKETFKLGFAEQLQDDLPAISQAFRDLFPSIEGFSSRIADALGPSLTGYLQSSLPALDLFLESFGRLGEDLMSTWTPVMAELTTQLAVAFEAARPGLRALSDAFADVVGMMSSKLPAISGMFTTAAFGVQDMVSAIESIQADKLIDLVTASGGLSGNLSQVSASLLGIKWLFLSLMEEISGRMETLFRALPGGIGDSVADSMNQLRAGINTEMTKTKAEVDRMTMNPKIRATVEDIESDLNRIAAKVEASQTLLKLKINPDSISKGDVDQLIKLAGLDEQVLIEAGFDPAHLQAQVAVLDGVIGSMPADIKAQLNFDREKARQEVSQIGAEAAAEWYAAVSGGDAPRLIVDAVQANATIDKTIDQIVVYDSQTGTVKLAADATNAELAMAMSEQRIAKWDSTTGTSTLFSRDEASATIEALGRKVLYYDASTGETTLYADNSRATRNIQDTLAAVANYGRTTATATLNVDNSSVFGKVNAALAKVGEFGGTITAALRATGGPIGFADGGQVPVRLSNGEFVLSSQTVKRIGVGNALALNAGRAITPGPVRGPGTSTSDSVAGTLPAGSFVIKASSVRKLGTGYLRSLAAGGMASGAAPAKVGGGNSYNWTVNARTEPSEQTMLTLLRRADAIYGGA